MKLHLFLVVLLLLSPDLNSGKEKKRKRRWTKNRKLDIFSHKSHFRCPWKKERVGPFWLIFAQRENFFPFSFSFPTSKIANCVWKGCFCVKKASLLNGRGRKLPASKCTYVHADRQGLRFDHDQLIHGLTVLKWNGRRRQLLKRVAHTETSSMSMSKNNIWLGDTKMLKSCLGFGFRLFSN